MQSVVRGDMLVAIPPVLTFYLNVVHFPMHKVMREWRYDTKNILGSMWIAPNQQLWVVEFVCLCVKIDKWVWIRSWKWQWNPVLPHLFVCLFVCCLFVLFVCLFVCLLVRSFVCLFICFFVCNLVPWLAARMTPSFPSRNRFPPAMSRVRPCICISHLTSEPYFCFQFFPVFKCPPAMSRVRPCIRISTLTSQPNCCFHFFPFSNVLP